MSVAIDTAERLLEKSPDPVPRLKILRDILKEPEGSRELAGARAAAQTSRWPSTLAAEQLDHGGWARFHSSDSQSGNKILTTEFGVERAIDCGLRGTDPLLDRTTHYLEGLLDGSLRFPDRPESNDRWPAGRDLFVASTLVEIDPERKILDEIHQTWIEIARRTFSSGDYNADHELTAHQELTGATTMRDSYLVIHNRYALTVLGCRQNKQLNEDEERALMKWLWRLPRLGYLAVPPGLTPADLGPGNAEGWLRTQLILSRFRSWTDFAGDTVEKLLTVRADDGLWDFGPTRGLKLSENWRRRDNRRIDHTVFVLRILQAAGI